MEAETLMGRLNAEQKDALSKYKASKSNLALAERERKEQEKLMAALNAELVRLRKVESDALEGTDKLQKEIDVSDSMVCVDLGQS